MTQVINLNPRNWKKVDNQIVAEDNRIVELEVQKQLLDFYGVPGTLLNVDKKYGTNTVLEVLRNVPKIDEMQVLTDEDKIVSVIDPKSKFISDDDFNKMCEKLNEAKLNAVEVKNSKGTRQMSYELEATDDDNFIGDLFKRKVLVERKNTGGVYMSLDLLRLACTNGMLVNDKQFYKFSRVNPFEDAAMKAYMSDMHAMSLKDYLNSLWYKDGELIGASVADFIGMKKTLEQITDSDVADMYFPMDPILNHYGSQGIDVESINNNLRSRMPSGLSYYDVYNILTNGVKQAVDITLEDRIKVAAWTTPSRIRQVKQSAVHFEGRPHFDMNLVESLKGDKEMLIEKAV